MYIEIDIYSTMLTCVCDVPV